MKHWIGRLFCLFAFLSAALACDSSDPMFETAVSPVTLDRNYIRDAEGRYLHLRGTNVSGSTKAPYTVNPSDPHDFTYIGRPFPEEEMDRWFAHLRDTGMRTIRLLFMWEAVMPEAQGEVDEAFLDYFEKLIRKANEHGIYVVINAHENLWSRFLHSMYNETPDLTDIEEILADYADPLTGQSPMAGMEGLLGSLLSLFPPKPNDGKPSGTNMLPYGYTDKVAGDGAPFWATRIALPEKNFDSKYWGIHHLLGSLALDENGDGAPDLKSFVIDTLLPLIAADEALNGESFLNEEQREMVGRLTEALYKRLPKKSWDRTETTDMLPFTFWGTNVVISLDVERAYAAFFAGEKVFPKLRVENGEVKSIEDVADPENAPNLKEYLQEGYEKAWVAVAERAKKYPNVIGYDLMNEPTSVFILMTVVAAYFQTGLESTIKDVLNGMEFLQSEIPSGILVPGEPDSDDPINKTLASKLYYILKYLDLLPRLPDPDDPKYADDEDLLEADKAEVKRKWGFADMDLFAAAGLNNDFDRTYLRPLFERVGKAVQEVDPDAIIWIEPAFSPAMLLGGGGLGGQWEQYPIPPAGIDNLVYSPHWYPDIYPYIGFNKEPREFSVEEYRYRDYTEHLQEKMNQATYGLENMPVVYGEFGTYWNYRYRGEDAEKPGWQQSREQNYRLSAEILDNFYEAFEGLFLSNLNWCYTPGNDPLYGDWWNHEDFSIIDENGEPRGWEAWIRPYPLALSGKPVSMHFYSPLHYFDPEKGLPDAEREFELVFESKETEAPTKVFVPNVQYPDGFYVWLSDGWAAWDDAGQTLYYHPEKDEPGVEHKLTLRPPIEGQDVNGWNYFIRGDEIVGR